MNINGEFASINGKLAIINGTPPLKAIVAASEAYPKGWHEGDVGGLSAIETNLAPANIKETTSIFGKVGTYEGEAPTVIQRIFYQNNSIGVDDEWVTKGTFAIPASAKRIAHGILTVSEVSTGSCTVKARALYDGVEKNLAQYSGVRGTCAFSRGIFAGLGSEATLNLQHWSTTYSTSYCDGVAYSVE